MWLYHGNASLVALLTTSWFWGWHQVAGILALSWGGVTRIGEATAALRKNLLLPSDFGWTIGYVLLQISEPKTRYKAARHQVARVDRSEDVLENFWMCWVFRALLVEVTLAAFVQGEPHGSF